MKQKAFIQSAAIALYCTAVGTVMANSQQFFGQLPEQFAPIMMLLLFSSSALICGLLAFYQPYLLFFGNKKKDAINFVVYEAAWLFMFFLAVVFIAFIAR